MKIGSLFSGIGGIDIGFLQADLLLRGQMTAIRRRAKRIGLTFRM